MSNSQNTTSKNFTNYAGRSLENDCNKESFVTENINVDAYFDIEEGTLVRMDIGCPETVEAFDADKASENFNVWMQAMVTGEAFVPVHDGGAQIDYLRSSGQRSGKVIPILRIIRELVAGKYTILEPSLHMRLFDPARSIGMFVGAVRSDYTGPLPVSPPATDDLWRPLVVAENGRLQTGRWSGKSEAVRRMSQQHDIISYLADGSGYSIFFGWISGRRYADGKRNYAMKVVEYLRELDTNGLEAAEAMYFANKEAAVTRKKVYNSAKAQVASGAPQNDFEVKINNTVIDARSITTRVELDVFRNGAYADTILVDPQRDDTMARFEQWKARGADFKKVS